MNRVEINQVEQVYSGKPGCMCGCLGTYYEASDPASARMIKKVVGIINNAVDVDSGNACAGGKYFATEIGGRVYAVYTRQVPTALMMVGA